MSLLKNGQKSLRVVLPDALYNKLKKECPEHGDMSKLIRKLIIKHFEALKDEDKLEAGEWDARDRS